MQPVAAVGCAFFEILASQGLQPLARLQPEIGYRYQFDAFGLLQQAVQAGLVLAVVYQRAVAAAEGVGAEGIQLPEVFPVAAVQAALFTVEDGQPPVLPGRQRRGEVAPVTGKPRRGPQPLQQHPIGEQVVAIGGPAHGDLAVVEHPDRLALRGLLRFVAAPGADRCGARLHQPQAAFQVADRCQPGKDAGEGGGDIPVGRQGPTQAEAQAERGADHQPRQAAGGFRPAQARRQGHRRCAAEQHPQGRRGRQQGDEEDRDEQGGQLPEQLQQQA